MAVAERLLCPTSGQLCTYRTHLEELHETHDLGYELAPGYINPLSDSSKLAVRLIEHGAAARLLNCPGLTDVGTCLTAEFMANNVPRSAAKTVAKKVLSIVRGIK